MATYYNYAERSADSYIDWSKVGKDMSDMLTKENKIREDKKAAIDQASREFGEVLSAPPQGEHKGANQWALEYSDNASQYMLMQDRLLKSGNLKLKDYTVGRQNIVDGTKTAFNLTKEYQTEFADKMERYKTNKSQDLEQWLMSQAEGFSDFNKSQLYISPVNGTVSVAMKEKKIVDGKEVYVMNQDPNTFTTVNSLRNQIKGKYDKFDTNVSTDAFVNGLGVELDALRQIGSQTRAGTVTSVLDITNRKDLDPATGKVIFQFETAEKQAIDGMLVNPYNRLSVLTNSKKFAPNGKQYSFTYSESERNSNPNLILLKKDPSSDQPIPDFTNEQMKDSFDFVKNEARAKYDYKKTINPYNEPQPQQEPEWKSQAAQAAKKNVDVSNTISLLWGGTPSEIKTSLNALRDINPNIQSIERTPTQVTVQIIDPNTRKVEVRRLPLAGTTQEEFIVAAAPLLAGISDVKTAIRQGGYKKGAKFNADVTESAIVETQQRQQQQANPFSLTPQGYTPPIAPTNVNAGGLGSKY